MSTTYLKEYSDRLDGQWKILIEVKLNESCSILIYKNKKGVHAVQYGKEVQKDLPTAFAWGELGRCLWHAHSAFFEEQKNVTFVEGRPRGSR